MYYDDGYYQAAGIFSGVGSIIWLALVVLGIVAMWRVFAKAGLPGCGAIIPFYNAYLLFKLAWGNGWLFLLMLIPIVNVIVGIVVLYKLAQSFGHGVGFTLGLIFLNFIFMLILGFGSDEYYGPAGAGN